jgi:hypothetical protein
MMELLGWTMEEEAVFAEIQRVSRLSGIKSIHLWKRCRKNAERAITIAKCDYPPTSEAERAKKVKAAAVAATLRKARSLMRNGQQQGQTLPARGNHA